MALQDEYEVGPAGFDRSGFEKRSTRGMWDGCANRSVQSASPLCAELSGDVKARIQVRDLVPHAGAEAFSQREENRCAVQEFDIFGYSHNTATRAGDSLPGTRSCRGSG